jgi:CRP/FNR family transcriptional regulator, anaerobic regulatory protein
MSAQQEGMPEVLQAAPSIEVPAGSRVFAQGQQASNYLFVTAGSVRVFARSSEGREVVLYRVQAGEMCTLTTSCMLGRAPYPAEAITESDVSARVLGAAEFDRALAEANDFRQFVFANFGKRLAEIMQRMEQLVLECVHNRLARCLVRRAGPDGVAVTTHEELALDVGTAREVVSRHLKAMEQSGLIALQRGRIVLRHPEILRLM